MIKVKGQGKLDEFAFVLLAGLIIIIVMLLVWGVPGPTQVPTINPTSKTLSIEKGESEKFILEINVSSKVVTLTAKGTIKDWVTFSDNNFESEGLTNVEVTVKVPSGTETRDYYGSIIVESQERGQATMALTVKVKPKTEEGTEQLSRPIYIGDFTVSYARGTETVKTESNIEVKKSMSEDKKTTISADITRDMSLVTDGSLILDVFYTNGGGNLVVKFNNEVVYDDKPSTGEITIPLDNNLLKSYNVIEVSTSKSGWMFWTTSDYQIEKLEFKINYFGDIEKKEIFEVYADELTGFKEGLVSFNVINYEGTGHLKVDINGYTLYDGVRRGPFELSFNFADVGLVKGMNTISFTTEKETSYEIQNAKIVITHEQPKS
jgi:hypothetical protein